jgi:hypothetical protein
MTTFLVTGSSGFKNSIPEGDYVLIENIHMILLISDVKIMNF